MLAGPLTLLRFDADPPLAYIEHGAGNALLDDEAATSEVEKAFEIFETGSLDIGEVKL